MAGQWLPSKDKAANIDITDKEVDAESLSSYNSHVFQDPVVCEYYKDLYEKTNYECRHHFDPEITWTLEEEKKILWINDWRVTFWAFIMFTGLNLDRYNIKQAVSDSMLDDLNLTTDDYNLGNTINLVCFLAAELPSQLISKKLGADIWIPTQVCIWSIVSLTQFWIKSKAGFLVTRALVGAFEGGFICDMVLFMSYFYTGAELPWRLSLFYISNPLTSVISALLAAALLLIKTKAVPEGWRFMFLIEGLITLTVGILSYFMMPASAVETKKWYRKNGWYTDRQEKILVNKVLRDDPNKGDMNNRQPVTLKELGKALFDIDLFPIYVVRFLGDIGSSPVSTYLTLTLKNLGFSTVVTNLLSIPFNFISIITMMFTGWLSERINDRALVIATTPLWVAICTLVLRFWPDAQVNVWGTYALLTVLLGHAAIWPLTITWCSSNSNSVRSRAVSSAVVNIFSQAAGIVSANIYRDDDKPLYKRGNTDLIIVAFAAIAACVLARFYFIFRNKYNEKRWNALTVEEQEKYLETTTDEGNKKINFKFVY